MRLEVIRVKINMFTQLWRILALTLAAISLSNAVAVSVSGRQRLDQVQDPVRQQALLALEDLIAESKNYEEQGLRARVKAQASDMIWPTDPDRARSLIAAAFDDTAAIKENVSARYDLRSEIVAIARRHDPEFAAKLISRLDDKTEQSTERLERTSLERISERGALYLDSARQLLFDGKQDRALEFARQSLAEGRSAHFIWLLRELRERNQKVADQLFLDALNVVRQRSSDPNDVLQLGLYLFSQDSMVVSTIDDQVIVSKGINFSAAPQPPLTLMMPYLQAAAEVLVRFKVIANQPGSEGAIELKRFALRQLLPLFERYEPDRAAALRAEMLQLSSSPTQVEVSGETHGTGNPGPPSEQNLSTVETVASIERLTDARERDERFFNATIQALHGRDFERAQTLGARISESDLKLQVLELLSFLAARKAIESGEPDEAEKIATSQLKQDRKAAIYYQLASVWMQRGDSVRANAEMNAAIAEAAKTDDRAQRARVYIYLAVGLAGRDTVRAFELVEAAVKDINAVEQFDLKNGQLAFYIRKPRGGTYRHTFNQEGNLLSVVPQLARADLYRTISLARSLRPAPPRAFTVIAACRAILSGDKKSNESKKPDPAVNSSKKDKGEKQ